MPSYIPTGKILGDPTKPARHYYILEPFLKNVVHPKARWWDEILDECMSGINSHLIGQVELYRIYHEKLLDALPRLREKTVVFQNGVVPDMSQELPQRLGIDHASSRHRLSYEQIKIFRKHPEIRDTKAFVFQPVAPVMIPYCVDGEKAPPVFLNEIEETNVLMEDRVDIFVRGGKIHVVENPPKFKMDEHVRELEADFKTGLYKFSPAMYDSTLAKRYFPEYPPEVVDRYCTFNRHVLANAFANYMNIVEIPEEVPVYAMRTSYAQAVMQKAAEISDRKIHDLSMIMRNKRYPLFAECEPSCLAILEGWVTATWSVKYA